MPGVRRRRRLPRCAYTDGRGRCRRNATLRLEGIPLCGSHAQSIDEPTARAAISDWFAEKIMGDERLGPVVEQITQRISIDDVIHRVVSGAKTRSQQIHRSRAAERPAPKPDPIPIWARNQESARSIPPNRPPPAPPPPPPRPDPEIEARKILHFGQTEALDREKIQPRRRQLAAMCHPDQGGDTLAMQQINAAADVLLAKYG